MKYFSRDVGKGIKPTVHEYRWEFLIEDIDVCIQYFIFKISNIRKIVYNHTVLKEEHAGQNNFYSYEFIEEGHHYKVTQTGDITSLYIDGASFDYNYTLEKNKKEFNNGNVAKIYNIYTKEDNDVIQASNEINFYKHNKNKQVLNFNIDIKNVSNSNKKNKNLNKFKFDSGEKIHINKYKLEKNVYSNNNIENNLIDFDKDYKSNNNNNYSIFNNNQHIIQNINNNDFFIEDQNNNNNNTDSNYNNNANINNNNLNQNYSNNDVNKNNYNNIFVLNKNYNNYKNNINQDYNKERNDFQNKMNYNNINYFNNNIMTNQAENERNDYNNIDIGYYGF